MVDEPEKQAGPSTAAERAGRLVRRTVARKNLVALLLALALVAVGVGAYFAFEGGSSRYKGPVFTDVTKAAGIDYVQDASPDCGDWQECGPEIMSGGAAAGDFDNDGAIDLAVTRIDLPPILYRNRGDGTFEDVSVKSGIGGPEGILGTNGVVFGDVNNDGCLDLYMTRVRKPNHALYINDCQGRFTDEAIARQATPLAPETGVFGQGVTMGDYDRDGYLDIFVTEWQARKHGTTGESHNRLLRNRGAEAPGRFVDETDRAGINFEGRSPLVTRERGVFGFAPAFVDLDGDGWQDLAVAADFGSSGLWWNKKDGTFEEGTQAAGVGTDENGMGSTFGDFDQDGQMDWFVTSIFDECEPGECSSMFGITGNRMYRNDGNRTFSDRTDRANVRDGAWGWGASSFDYDNDGDLDIAHTSGFHVLGEPSFDKFRTDPTFLQVNDGTGRFVDRGKETGIRDTAEGRGLLTLDYDNDGYVDLLIVQRRDRPRLFRNSGGDAGRLKVKLEGSGPNSTRDAVGARVSVVRSPGAEPQIREVGMRDNYLGQDPLELHFGLGDSKAEVAEVRVSWPSGCEQTLRQVARNSVLALKESECRR